MKPFGMVVLRSLLFGVVFILFTADVYCAKIDVLKQAVSEIKSIPYNPTSKFFTPVDFGALYSDFFSNFERVSFCAPGNGKTYYGNNSLLGQCTDPDIKLVGYLFMQNDPDRPGLVLTHGGGGPTPDIQTGEVYWPSYPRSVTGSDGALVGMAVNLKNNGYHVLAMDRRSGALTSCTKAMAYTPNHSCSYLTGYAKQDIPEDFVPQTRYDDRNTLAHADLMAGAAFLENMAGKDIPLGGLGGSRGGATMIQTAARQHSWVMGDDLSARIDAFFALSPYPGENYPGIYYMDGRLCSQVRSAAAYSEVSSGTHILPPVPGSGIGSVSRDDLSGMNDFYRLSEIVDDVKDITDPLLIINSLNDNDVTPEQGFAFHLKSQDVDAVETLTLAQGGHNNLLWRSDPFFMNLAILTFFKNTIGAEYGGVTKDPGLTNLGPNQDNPYWVKLPKNMPGLDNLLYNEPVEVFQDVLINNCFPPEDEL